MLTGNEQASTLRVSSLGSGSKGNATLVHFEETIIIVDSGFSCKTLEQRLNLRGISPEQITAMLVTHEHSDHFNGVPTFANKHQVPVWMSNGTSFHPKAEKIKQLNCFNSHFPFTLGNIQITPVLVPHDSREACQFVFDAGKKCLGILTDIGHITPFVASKFQECDILLLEFNHDINLLQNGRYPASLKQRVGGALGHLNNEQSAELLQTLNQEKLRYLVAMHLSEENNCRSLVNETAKKYISDMTEFFIADQESGFDWINI